MSFDCNTLEESKYPIIEKIGAIKDVLRCFQTT